MTRTTERGVWIGAILLLLVLGAVLFLGPAGRMIGQCQDMMSGVMTRDDGAPPASQRTRESWNRKDIRT